MDFKDAAVLKTAKGPLNSYRPILGFQGIVSTVWLLIAESGLAWTWAGQGRAGQGRAAQGRVREGQGRTGQGGAGGGAVSRTSR